MLGHASAAMTLDIHAGLFGDDLLRKRLVGRVGLEPTTDGL